MIDIPIFQSRIGPLFAFQYPFFLLGGIMIVTALAVIWQKKAAKTAVRFQFSRFFQTSLSTKLLMRSKRSLYLLLVLIFFIILAHPQRVNQTKEQQKKGIDIVLALDISYSMEANDFQPNRVEAAKSALQSFLKTRTTDRIGLVVFAGKPFTSIPLTFDYSIFEEILSRTSTATIDQNYQQLQGTAVGDALLSSIALLKKGREDEEKKDDREQIIVLFTDGEANVGVDPLVIAELAREQHIEIYTVGIGSLEGGFITMQTPFGVRQQQVGGIDETTLQKIAERTNGQYARAIDSLSLEAIIQTISKLKPTEITDETQIHLRDARLFFVLIAYGFLVILAILERKSASL